MWWTPPKIWQNGECWIIGGGPSVARQFDIPAEVVQDVKEGRQPLSVYAPYMSVIHKEHVIGVNVAYKLGDWVDVLFFGDQPFYRTNRPGIARFKGLAVTCSRSERKWKGVKELKRADKGGVFGLSGNPGYMKWNTNSGAAAINLAYHLGVKRIYLLGFDMDLKDPERHWHMEYGKRNGSVPYRRHVKAFPVIAEHAAYLGLEIINVNPDSAINEFPKRSLQQILEEKNTEYLQLMEPA